MRVIILIFIAISILSCNRTSKVSIEKSGVYKVVIEEFGKANLPPPLPGKLHNFSKQELDSIFGQEQKIAIYPILNINKEEINLNKIKDSLYSKIAKKLTNLDKDDLMDLSKINTRSSLHLSLIDTLEQKKNSKLYYKNFDKLLYLSPISFNEELSRAITIVGVGINFLNGFSALIYLEKQEDEWVIVKSEELTIS